MAQLIGDIDGVWKDVLVIFFIPFKKRIEIGVNIDAGADGLFFPRHTGGKQIDDLLKDRSEPGTVVLLDRSCQIFLKKIDIKIFGLADMVALVVKNNQRTGGIVVIVFKGSPGFRQSRW